jgi:dipeptidase
MCDTLCIVTNRHTMFAKASDRPPDEPQVLEAYPARAANGTLRTQYLEIPDAGAFALVGSRPTWLWGFEHGVNEHGLAIGNEAVYTTEPPTTEPGLIGMDLVRLGLERARSARDAVEVIGALLERHGQSGDCYEHGGSYHSSFLVADPQEVWQLETAGRTWAARRSGSAAAISNRISLRSDWDLASDGVAPNTDVDTWRDPGTDTGFADVRLATSLGCIARGDASPEALVAQLRDHRTTDGLPPSGGGDDAFSVCMHIRGVSNTTAAIVAQLEAGTPPRIWTALGSPCASVFVPFTFPEVPALLADPNVWQRFAALRDRVEADGRTLAEVTAVLRPVEAALWAGADDPDGSVRAALDSLAV